MSQDTHSNQNQGSEPVASEGHKVNWSTLPEDVFRVFETRTAHNSAVYLLPTLQEIQSRNPQMKLLDVYVASRTPFSLPFSPIDSGVDFSYYE